MLTDETVNETIVGSKSNDVIKAKAQPGSIDIDVVLEAFSWLFEYDLVSIDVANWTVELVPEVVPDELLEVVVFVDVEDFTIIY